MNDTFFQNIVLNNLRAIVVHVVICFVLMLPTGFTWRYGVWWRGMSQDDIRFNWVLVIIFTLVTALLYFLFGRKFLSPSPSLVTNLISVAIIPIIIALAVIIAWSGTGRIGMLSLLAFSIHPISETISFHFRLAQPLGHIIMSPLPLIAMWLGLLTKR